MSTWMEGWHGCASWSQQRDFVWRHAGQFIMFGLVCQALEFIPVVNVLAFFSNFAGAGLLAAAIESGAAPSEPLLEDAPEAEMMPQE